MSWTTWAQSWDMRRKRPTDMRNNRNVRMPPPGSALLEVERNTRVGTWRKASKDYAKENCDSKGSQLKKNLTVNQMLGLKSLSRKVARLELLVLEADKGKKFVVVDEQTYVNMSMDHVGGDRPTSPAEVRHSQSVLSSTVKALGNAVNLGLSHSSNAYGRCMDNLGSQAMDVPVLKLLAKVHKPPAPGGHP